MKYQKNMEWREYGNKLIQNKLAYQKIILKSDAHLK